MTGTRDAGFTLIETLVALAVFALVAGAVQLCLAGGWRGVGLVRTEQAALRLAKAQLAGVGIENELVEGTVAGETPEGFAWSRDIRRHDSRNADGTAPAAIAGYWVRVAVRWTDGPLRRERSVELSTLKLGRGE